MVTKCARRDRLRHGVDYVVAEDLQPIDLAVLPGYVAGGEIGAGILSEDEGGEEEEEGVDFMDDGSADSAASGIDEGLVHIVVGGDA